MRSSTVYRHIGLDTEWIEDYRPGGYHPVHIGDRLGPNDRYVIKRKLGYGADGTVWLAKDPLNTEGKEYVAIKILKASKSRSGQGPSVYSQLSQSDKPLSDAAATLSRPKPPPWTQYIVPLLSSFAHLGPNGNHTCLVFEPMGCSMDELLLDRSLDPQLKKGSKSRSVDRGFNPRQSKSILRQILAGLVALHSKDLIHGDLHLGNVLLPHRVSQAYPKREPDVFTAQDPENDAIAEKVRRLDGRDLDKNAPRYLITHQSLAPYTALEHDQLKPKLIDAGGKAPEKGLNCKTPIILQSPELALEDTASPSQDIWAFGCAMFEVVTGFRLFSVNTLHTTPEGQIDELLLCFSETLGPLTPAIKAKWNRYSLYFDEQGQRIERLPHDRTQNDAEWEANNEDFGESTEAEFVDKAALAAAYAEYLASSGPAEEESVDEISPVLEDLIDRFKPSEMSSDEANRVKALLKRIFQFDPKKRPSAVDLQKDPWFATHHGECRGDPEPQQGSRSQGERKGKRKRSNVNRGKRRT